MGSGDENGSDQRSQFLAPSLPKGLLASSGDENKRDVDSSLQTQSSIAVIAAESAIKGEGPIQSKMDPFASFVCQTTDNFDNSYCAGRANLNILIVSWE